MIDKTDRAVFIIPLNRIDFTSQDSDLLEYVKAEWNNYWPLGSEHWEHLNLEDVLTSLAIENEFAPSDTDEKAKAQPRIANILDSTKSLKS